MSTEDGLPTSQEDLDEAIAEAELEVPAIPTPLEAEGTVSKDHKNILGGTAQNVVGVVVFGLATAIATVMLTRTLDKGVFGVVMGATTFGYITSAATRFGMDVACVRLVAILIGRDQSSRTRALVNKAVLISASISFTVGILIFLAAPLIANVLFAEELRDAGATAFRAAALGIPLGALAFVWMGATRGVKVMRFTLYGQWIGQPVSWITLMLAFWTVGKGAGITTLAFSCSWGVSMLIGVFGWRKLSSVFPRENEGEPIPEERTGALLRFGALRAPATLFSQAIFFTDYYVLTALWAGQGLKGGEIGDIYSGTLRVGQGLFLFLTSVSLTFSPFVADLHHRGERTKLDGLYKTVTRWALAATIPILLVLTILPAEVLHAFGKGYSAGGPALRILAMGMIVPVMVGTVGFILIMVGKTGWDLSIYLLGLALDIGLALLLAGPNGLGLRGAAIAQACTLTFTAVARLLLVRKFVGIWPFNAQYFRLIGPTVLAAVAMMIAHSVLPEAKWLVNLMGSAVIGTGVFVVAMLLVGMTPTERGQMKKVVTKFRGRKAATA